MKKENLDKMVEETMSSLDAAERATPAPFLLTRIKAKMANRPVTASAWERVGIFLTRPAVAFTVLSAVLLMNVYIIGNFVGSNSNTAAQSLQTGSDEFSMNAESISLFDFENIQP
jgi:hypothetical protein